MLDLRKSISDEFLGAMEREIIRILGENSDFNSQIELDGDKWRYELFLNSYESAKGKFSEEYEVALHDEWNKKAFEQQERIFHDAGIGGGGFSPYGS